MFKNALPNYGRLSSNSGNNNASLVVGGGTLISTGQRTVIKDSELIFLYSKLSN